jgi:hypothetical protein
VPLAPRADTYVRGVYSTTNYGTSTALYVMGSTKTSYVWESYLSFDVPVSVTNRRVVLRLASRLTASTPPVVAAVYPVSSTTWQETAVNYGTRPAAGATPLGTFSVASRTSTWVEIDVTSYVRAERARGRTRVAFALKGVGTSAARIAIRSRQASSDRPKLVVQ